MAPSWWEWTATPRASPAEPEGVIPFSGDVTAPTVLDEARAIAARQAEYLDIPVNDAGLARPPAIEYLEVGEFERVYAVPVPASIYGIRFVVHRMRRQGSGRIIHVISWAAEACQLNSSAYSSAKGVRWALSRSAACVLGSSGILVNRLIPGMTNTGIWGRPRPERQDPQCVYPTALALATLPGGGPSGRVWYFAEYPLFSQILDSGCEVVR